MTSTEQGLDAPRTRVVLVGVDGTRTSWRAAAFAAALAARQDALLVALHVRQEVLDGECPEGAESERAAQDAASSELRAELLTAAGRTGLRLELAEDVGEPVERLVHWAELRRVDLVVVGSSDQAGHRQIGSIGLELVRLARWPVTVVP